MTRELSLYFVVSRRSQPARPPHLIVSSFNSLLFDHCYPLQNTDSISILPSLPNLLPHSLLSRLSGRVPTTDSIPNSVRSPQNSMTFFSPPATSGFPVLFQRRAPLPHTNVMPINHPLHGAWPAPCPPGGRAFCLFGRAARLLF